MKKNLFRLPALLALLVLLPAMALAADFAVVRGGRLNLREYASTSSRSLGLYNTGSWVRIEGQAINGWWPVRTMDGKTGYMAGNYLTFAATGNTGVVRYANGGYVNLRRGPSLDYQIITRVTSGTTVTILNDSYEWNYISAPTANGTYTGYMHDSFIDKNTSTATVTTRYGGKVNVRPGPSSSYKSVGSLASGTRVNVLLKGNGWYQISGGGLTGFMSTSYLSGTGSTVGSNTGSGGSTSYTVAYVNNPRSTQVLNLREMPSQSSRSIGQYRNGTQVKVVSYGNTWCEVYVGTRHGYMMTQYLSFNGSGGSTSYTVAYVNNPRSTQVLNLREMPSQSSRSIGQYRNGTQVKVVSYGNTWCEVYVGTRHGYMMTQYLSFNGNYLPPSYPSAPSYPTVTATPPLITYITPTPTQIPYVTPTPPLITYITPKPQQPPPEPPAAGTTISLAPSAVGGGSAINVYNDASLTSLKATYSNGTRATMLTYGENVCMILIDGGVAYVSTWNVNY